MTDWYEEGMEKLRDRIAEESRHNIKTVEHIVDAMDRLGLIDYDFMKEVILEMEEDERRYD